MLGVNSSSKDLIAGASTNGCATKTPKNSKPKPIKS